MKGMEYSGFNAENDGIGFGIYSAHYPSSRKLRHEAIRDLLKARLSLKGASEYINTTTRGELITYLVRNLTVGNDDY
ncbi:hypothetical protein CZ814_00643 [Photobacterium toruni]|uniref:Uncharacterized protein n=1 Tax=Photobacterium toruni TaxID=1935446 RepID=A0A1T4NG71_9GAMM|nr:hypothetical protein CZ814_00643 [Photobacterium toruni]